jgi:hypothetical protein
MKRLALFFAAACLSCAVAYKLIGQRIDERGRLHEPFALIPLGYLAGTAALMTGSAAVITSSRRKRHKP